ncbi:MAG: hypothetical protein JW751_22635 [Polyangiaceae bacterium]|nr:hypothetical protein [Polyangiaceae bacterium]
MTSPTNAMEEDAKGNSPSDGQGRRKRRRRRKPLTPADVTARAITQSGPETHPGPSPKLADDPLTPGEIAELKRHFRFLREYRKVLNLKLNAQEDLLINERRAPDRRGVCQHLLGKVDRKRVFAAAERMVPTEAVRLVEGVLGIAPDVDYVLLYLDCVRRTGAHEQAIAALSEALERIDFREASPGQMRRVLDLVVELFDERSLPTMLLGLLEGSAFRRAFDAVAPELPPALARLVVPLRAAQGVVLHGRRSPSGVVPLRDGIRLLLHGDLKSLQRYPAPVRHRLVELGAEAWAGRDETATRVLLVLLESLQQRDSDHGELCMAVAGALIAHERDEDARRLLANLTRAHPDLEDPPRWLHALDAPRWGRIALVREAGRRPRGPGAHSPFGRRLGVDLSVMQPVWVYAAPPDRAAAQAETAAFLAELCVPGMARIAGNGEHGGEHWFAVSSLGEPLPDALERHGGAPRRTALAMARDAVSVLAALAAAGAVLPDADLHRFEADPSGRVWLVDARCLARAATTTATDTMLLHARELVRRILEGAQRYVPPLGMPESLPTIRTFAELARCLV